MSAPARSGAPPGRRSPGAATAPGPSVEVTTTDTPTVPEDEVRRWVRALVARARQVGPIPRYGTEEWLSLPGGDLRRLAGLASAAEAWRDCCSAERVAAELAEELADRDWDVRRRMAEASHDVSVAWAEPNTVGRMSMSEWVRAVPTHAELQRRRQLIPDRPGGDYPGRIASQRRAS